MTATRKTHVHRTFGRLSGGTGASSTWPKRCRYLPSFAPPSGTCNLGLIQSHPFINYPTAYNNCSDLFPSPPTSFLKFQIIRSHEWAFEGRTSADVSHRAASTRVHPRMLRFITGLCKKNSRGGPGMTSHLGSHAQTPSTEGWTVHSTRTPPPLRLVRGGLENVPSQSPSAPDALAPGVQFRPDDVTSHHLDATTH